MIHYHSGDIMNGEYQDAANELNSFFGFDSDN